MPEDAAQVFAACPAKDKTLETIEWGKTLLGISMIGVCEAFALAEKLGLDAARFFEIASKSSGQCWSLTTYCPWPRPVPTAPSNRGYEGGFATATMLKDLKLAQEAAAKAGASTPLGATAEGLYPLFDRLGGGPKDFSAILEMLAPAGRLCRRRSGAIVTPSAAQRRLRVPSLIRANKGRFLLARAVPHFIGWLYSQ